MAIHSSTLTWKIWWMEEPGGLCSMGSLRVWHNWVSSLSLFYFPALEKEMATYFSVLAWRIPGTGEPSGLPSMGSHRVGHDWSNLAAACMHCTDQFSSVAQLCPTLCDVIDCSLPGFSVHHQLLELVQTHIYWVSDAIQPSHPLLSHSPPAFNLAQHLGVFQWTSSSHHMSKVLEFLLQHQSFQWLFRTDFL